MSSIIRKFAISRGAANDTESHRLANAKYEMAPDTWCENILKVSMASPAFDGHFHAFSYPKTSEGFLEVTFQVGRNSLQAVLHTKLPSNWVSEDEKRLLETGVRLLRHWDLRDMVRGLSLPNEQEFLDRLDAHDISSWKAHTTSQEMKVTTTQQQ
ncbi:hypothetical protein VDGL01_10270 [Verticillium dahliae]